MARRQKEKELRNRAQRQNSAGQKSPNRGQEEGRASFKERRQCLLTKPFKDLPNEGTIDSRGCSFSSQPIPPKGFERANFIDTEINPCKEEQTGLCLIASGTGENLSPKSFPCIQKEVFPNAKDSKCENDDVNNSGANHYEKKAAINSVTNTFKREKDCDRNGKRLQSEEENCDWNWEKELEWESEESCDATNQRRKRYVTGCFKIFGKYKTNSRIEVVI